MKNVAKALIAAIVLMNVADSVISYIAIDNGWAAEANPLGATAISHLGLAVSLVLGKIPIMLICWWLFCHVGSFKSFGRTIPLAGVAMFFVSVLVNNSHFLSP